MDFDGSSLFAVFNEPVNINGKESAIPDEDIPNQEEPQETTSSLPPKRPKEVEEEENLSENNQTINEIPRMTIVTLPTDERCTHKAVLPHGTSESILDTKDAEQNADEEPPIQFPFTLDPFQKESIDCVKKEQSVLVSAHTSAGKTVVALYTIAQALKRQQRVIYTSPLKALSNQKYCELTEKFSDVGLLTGDVSINPTAVCLVMTTEILRSMLYRGSDILQELGWVVFDEVHYMRDSERGVVWEETIILLPDNVHYVFLSATIPNSIQFAEWIVTLHQQPCHIISTEYRPTPLKHYIYPVNTPDIHLIVDEKTNFLENNLQNAMAQLKDKGSSYQNDRQKRLGGRKNSHDCYDIVRMMTQEGMAPIIVFSFSRRDCETFGMQMKKLDLTTKEEKKLIEEVFKNATDILSEEDKKLPLISECLPLLKQGIGIHHSGLLPIVKEAVELLFAEGLLRVLFATETFAMGLNMPARSVVFTKSIKFDGVERRYIKSGEYIQMSGRAGRRGLDTSGFVIMMCDEKISEDSLKNMILGSSDPLNSAFYLTYTMVLNLLRVDGINPEFIMQRSFRQFQSQSTIPRLVEELEGLKKEENLIICPDEAKFDEYSNLLEQLNATNDQIRSIVMEPKYILKFLNPGRLVRVVTKRADFGWCVVSNHIIRNLKQGETPSSVNLNEMPLERIRVNVLIRVDGKSSKTTDINALQPFKPASSEATVNGNSEKPSMAIKHVQIVPTVISQISTINCRKPGNVQNEHERSAVINSLEKILKNTSEPPLLDPKKDMNISNSELDILLEDRAHLTSLVDKNDIVKSVNFATNLLIFNKKKDLRNKIQDLSATIEEKQSLLLVNELENRKKVLRKLKYIDDTDAVQIKGRMACEISCGDPLILTELVFDQFFDKLTYAQIAATLSCFIFQEKGDPFEELQVELIVPFNKIKSEARRIARISHESGLEIDETKYVERFSCGAMNAIYLWSSGSPFGQIMTDNNFEGSLVRAMRRLQELLKELRASAQSIGNSELDEKLKLASESICRDIVFASSLYV